MDVIFVLVLAYNSLSSISKANVSFIAKTTIKKELIKQFINETYYFMEMIRYHSMITNIF